MSLGALAFLNPWLLAAVAALPIIYWLLRTVPPRPHQVAFPPTRILVGLENREKTPAKTPWWLLLIRLLAALLVILALAEPILNPSRETAIGGQGPLVLVADNGWAAAPRWGERMGMLDGFISEAESRNRPVVILATASAAKTPTVRIESPSDARSTAAALVPWPFAPDRLAAAAALEAALAGGAREGVGIVWLTDGIDHRGKARDFLGKLQEIAGEGSVAVVDDAPGTEPLGLMAGLGGGGKLDATVLRAQGPAREATLHALSARGQRLGEATAKFGPGATNATASFDMPLELRNQVTRVEIAGERSAGAVSLLDARSQWRRVGLLSGESREQAQPLLAPLYYIQRALAPFADLIQPKDSNLAAGINAVLEQNASMLVLADIGTLSGEAAKRVTGWVAKGGLLVRFAGPRLEKGGDDLMPVPLRIGGRTLGGALSWSTPQPLAPFDGKSPFAGLDVPADVTVSRQVLADPARIGPEVEVWARLKDGTPLVTAARRGQGRVVVFHVTANSDWSSLPMSGLFVEMLRRTMALAGSVAGGAAAETNSGEGAAAAEQGELLPPMQTLDGFGTIKPPPPSAQPVASAKLDGMEPSLDHPPGYYGTSGSPRALNTIGPKSTLAPLPALPAGVERRGYASEAAVPLKSWLLAAALALLFIDIVAVLLLQMGGLIFARLRPRGGVALLMFAIAGVAFLAHGEAGAQERALPRPPPLGEGELDSLARRATSKVTFGYVVTGNPDADQTSRLGLEGLNKVLALRTAVEPGEPMAVDIEKDEIAFFPVLYWPVLPNAQALEEAAVAKIDAYMKQGGMIIFDTRDYGQGVPSGFAQPGEDNTALQRLLGRLDLPRLEPVPENHVITKSFYLLRFFPGRWDGGQLWVEATGEGEEETGEEGSRQARKADGVTSILVTSNDFAAAWALDDRGTPLYPVVPGGEMQREMSFRTGVNIVMHALTGNYKADQVHVPHLLERLGQ